MKKIIVLAMCFMMIGLFGCGKKDTDVLNRKNTEEPVCGGVTNNTDYDAPKVINSDNLVKLSMGFYHEDKFDKSNGRYYTFILESDSDGKILLKDRRDDEGFTVDKSVLDGAQKIIKKYDLAKANGVNKITAGLPPEYEECDFSAEYDSGERISFAENSDPSSEWGREFIDYFAPIFAANGDNKYLPSEISGTITCFNLEIQKDSTLYQYNTEGENQIYRCIYDCAKEEVLSQTCVDASSEYYDGILKIVRDREIRDFENYDSASDFVSDGKTPAYYDFYIEFDDGNKMSGASCEPEILEKFMPMGTELMNYMDEFIDYHS